MTDPAQPASPDRPIIDRMTPSSIPLLQRSIDAWAIPGIIVDHRVIEHGDEGCLLPGERETFAASVPKVQRASAAARMVARGLMLRLGLAQQAIPKSASGAPIWPVGVVGSLAHDSRIAVAALALRRDYSSLGIDVEPAEPLDPELLDIVATPAERQRIEDDPYRGRLLFAVKEAVYKAVHPLDGVFLDHHDVEVSLAAGTAIVRRGRTVRFKHCVAGHIVALAFIPALPAASGNRA